MRIQHNIPAMNAYRSFKANNSALSKNLEKLSSGYKVNRAGDDAAGLAISEKMRAQITGLQGAQRNAKDGISLVQTAEGALQEVHDMLNRMYSLAEQSANGTYDLTLDRQQMQKEVEAIRSEIDRIADSANFNGITLLDGNMSSAKVGTTSGTDAVDHEDGEFATAQFTFGSALRATTVEKSLALAGVTLSRGEYANAAAVVDAWKAKFWNANFASATVGGKSWQDKTDAYHNASQYQDRYVFEVDGSGITMAAVLGTATSTTAWLASLGFTGSTASYASMTYNNVHSFVDVFINKTAIANSSLITAHEKFSMEFLGETVTKSSGEANTLEDLVIAWMGVPTNAAKLSEAVGSNWSWSWSSSDPLTINFTAADWGKKTQGPITGASLVDSGKDEVVAQSATPAKTTIDFTGKSALDMQDVSIEVKFKDSSGNTQTHVYEFTNASRGNNSGSGNTSSVYIPANASTGDIVNALNTALGQDLDGYTASVSGNSVIIQSNQGGADSVPADVTIVNGGLRLLVGDTADSFNYMRIAIDDVHCQAIGVNALDISTQNGAASALDAIKTAINTVSDIRGGLGAIQNRLDHTINNLSVMEENITDAESTIRDTDVAEEMMKYTKNNILNQAAQAMLAQANQAPQGVLQLLQ